MNQIFSYLTFGCIVLLTLFAGTCKNDSPVKPQPPTPPDTTSHDYQFTLYEVGGRNSVFFDVAALSPDFVIAVGKIEGSGASDHPTNAYLWNSFELKPISLPINPHDTFTVNPSISFRIINNIWIFRRDHIWYSTEYGAVAQLTIAGTDSNVKNINYRKRSDIVPSFGGRIWAKDTSEIYFGNMEGIMYKYKSGTWTPMTPATHGGNIDDLWGFDSNNIWTLSISSTNFEHTLFRYDGLQWKLLWLNGQPSLSDSVFFGAPTTIWGLNGEDSLWISGLYLGRMRKDGNGRVTIIRNNDLDGFYRIRGNAKNNVFFVGAGGAISHFNGSTIRDYQEFLGKGMSFNSVTVLRDEVFIVGSKSLGGAIFIYGKRKY